MPNISSSTPETTDPETTSEYKSSEEETNIEDLTEALEFLYLTPPTQQQTQPLTQQQAQPPTQQSNMSNQPSTSNAATIAATLRPVELKLGQPSTFDGDAIKARAWLNNVQKYLHVNKEVYNNEEKMITYALSFMMEGAAGLWATTFITKALKSTPPNFGSYVNFLTEFKESFIQENAKDQAIAWLTNTRVSNTLPLVDYISQFKNNTVLSEIANEDTLINFFSRGIPVPIMRRIFSMDTVPSMVDKWYSQAMHFKLTWERAESIVKGRGNPFLSFQNNNHKNYQRPVQKKDPNAMEVDAVQVGRLSPEERKKCMDNNLCFRCRKPGHLANRCWNPFTRKQQDTTPQGIAKIEEVAEEETYTTVGRLSTSDF